MARWRPGRFRQTTLPDVEIKLRCVECERLTDFERTDSSVYCAECGKRHGQKSLIDTSIRGLDDTDS